MQMRTKPCNPVTFVKDGTLRSKLCCHIIAWQIPCLSSHSVPILSVMHSQVLFFSKSLFSDLALVTPLAWFYLASTHVLMVRWTWVFGSHFWFQPCFVFHRSFSVIFVTATYINRCMLFSCTFQGYQATQNGVVRSFYLHCLCAGSFV